MKFSIAAAASLLLIPLGALASPVAEAAPVPAAVAEDAAEVREALIPLNSRDLAVPAAATDGEANPLLGHELFARANIICRIVNTDDYAKCCSGPGFDYPVTHHPLTGVDYHFSCYKRADCVNGNCTWEKLVWNGSYCYVNGCLTDYRCTPAALGLC